MDWRLSWRPLFHQPISVTSKISSPTLLLRNPTKSLFLVFYCSKFKILFMLSSYAIIGYQMPFTTSQFSLILSLSHVNHAQFHICLFCCVSFSFQSTQIPVTLAFGPVPTFCTKPDGQVSLQITLFYWSSLAHEIWRWKFICKAGIDYNHFSYTRQVAFSCKGRWFFF